MARTTVLVDAPPEPSLADLDGIVDYVLDGGDGYRDVKTNAVVLVNAEQGTLMVTALERYLNGREVSPKIDGRIVVEP